MTNIIEKRGFRVRKLTQDRVRFMRIADECVVGLVSRGALIALAHKLLQTKMINATEQSLLIAIINTADKSCYEQGGNPVVYKSNKQLAFEIGKSEGRVSRLLSKLYDLGLIVMRDSPNFKRYPTNQLDNANLFGIDLRILISRYSELKELIKNSTDNHNKMRILKRQFKSLSNQIKYAMEIVGAKSTLIKRVNKILSLDLQAYSLNKLAKVVSLLKRIFFHFFSKDNDVKMTYTYVKNDIHIQNTNPEKNNNCSNKTNNSTLTSTPDECFHQEKTLEEVPCKNVEKNILKEEKLHKLPEEILAKSLPQTAFLINAPINSLNDLIKNSTLIAKIIGCSQDAFNDAEKNMGTGLTALSLAIIYEKHYLGLINSPAGYLRALTSRFKVGKLNILKSLYGLGNAVHG